MHAAQVLSAIVATHLRTRTAIATHLIVRVSNGCYWQPNRRDSYVAIIACADAPVVARCGCAFARRLNAHGLQLPNPASDHAQGDPAHTHPPLHVGAHPPPLCPRSPTRCPFRQHRPRATSHAHPPTRSSAATVGATCHCMALCQQVLMLVLYAAQHTYY